MLILHLLDRWGDDDETEPSNLSLAYTTHCVPSEYIIRSTSNLPGSVVPSPSAPPCSTSLTLIPHLAWSFSCGRNRSPAATRQYSQCLVWSFIPLLVLCVFFRTIYTQLIIQCCCSSQSTHSWSYQCCCSSICNCNHHRNHLQNSLVPRHSKNRLGTRLYYKNHSQVGIQLRFIVYSKCHQCHHMVDSNSSYN